MLGFRLFKRFFGQASSPRRKNLNKLSIVLGEQIGLRVINFFTFAFVVRYVQPAELGILGLAWTFIYFVETLSGNGLVSAFIQYERINAVRKATFFWLCQFSGVFSALLVLILGVVAESVFGRAGITSICGCLGCLIIFRMSGLAHRSMVLREQRQGVLASRALISNVLSSGLGVYLALSGFGIWALLWKNVLQAFLHSAFIIMFNPWKPVRALDCSFTAHLFQFSLPLVGSQMVRMGIFSVEQVGVGSVLGLKMLGSLEVARRLPDIALQVGQGLIERFLFPLNAEKVRRGERLSSLYRRFSIFSLVVASMALSIIYPFSSHIVIGLFGSQWADLGFVFFLSCVVTTLSIYKGFIQSFLVSLGRSRAAVVDVYYMLGALPLFFFVLRWGLDEALMITIITHLTACIHLHCSSIKSMQSVDAVIE